MLSFKYFMEFLVLLVSSKVWTRVSCEKVTLEGKNEEKSTRFYKNVLF